MNAHTMRRAVAVPAGTTEANRAWLEVIVQAQHEGRSCLPLHLGLDAQRYVSLLPRRPDVPLSARALQRDDLRQELLELRRDEWQELRDLLIAGQDTSHADADWMASIVAAACLGGDHLWRDLGLPSRVQLQALLMHNFPLLAVRNTQDMRWKKFFYKQLCEQDGGLVCRSPSCNDCPTYQDCFGEEL